MSLRRARSTSSGVSLLLVAAGACAPPPLLRLPGGPGSPAADGAAVVAEATAACVQVSSIVAQASVSGSVDGQRVRATLDVGVAAPAAARLEAVAPFGRPLFTFVARGGRATLLLTRPDRVVTDADPAALLEAVTGVPLDPEGLRAALTGCARAPATDAARQNGDGWRIMREANADLYFRRESPDDRWQLVAVVHGEPGRPDWRAEYDDRAGDGLPRTLRLAGSGGRPFDLRLGLSQVETNTRLEAEVFELAVPPGARPMTLEELQQGAVLSEVSIDEDAGAR